MPNVIDLPRSADVVIIGAGFAGLATAWALAERGVRDVIVLEREATLGRYASGRGAGLGRQLAEDDAWTALTVRGAAVLRQRFSGAWTPTGGVLSFDNAEHAAMYVERAGRFDVEAEPISRDLLLASWPELGAVEITSALHIPSDGVIDVAALLRSYAVDREIAMSTRVQSIVPMQGGAKVVTSRGDIVARIVVDAAGPWAGHAAGDHPLDAYKRHIYLLDARAQPGSPFVWHLGACELYVRGAGDELLVSPCDSTAMPAGDAVADADGETKLRRAFAGTPLAATPISRAWACLRTYAPDGAMKLGRDPTRPWLVWAAGLGGHGATASAAVGETVASAVTSAL